jgi:hypothetical protein
MGKVRADFFNGPGSRGRRPTRTEAGSPTSSRPPVTFVTARAGEGRVSPELGQVVGPEHRPLPGVTGSHDQLVRIGARDLFERIDVDGVEHRAVAR